MYGENIGCGVGGGASFDRRQWGFHFAGGGDGFQKPEAVGTGFIAGGSGGRFYDRRRWAKVSQSEPVGEGFITGGGW